MNVLCHFCPKLPATLDYVRNRKFIHDCFVQLFDSLPIDSLISSGLILS